MDPVHIIVNPIAGQGKAPGFVDLHILPLLRTLRVRFEVHTTKSPRDAGQIGLEIARRSSGSAPIRAIIAGGDGTAHELIEGVFQGEGMSSRWELAILPLGTANALHASLFPDPAAPRSLPPDIQAALGTDLSPSDLHALSSFFLLLARSTPPRHLPITITTILDSAAQPTGPGITSHIVLSTALHAALLSDSESLRATHPGIDRFKIAAQNNLPIAFLARVKLHGPTITQYSPRSRRFVEPFTVPLNGDEHPGTELTGPFSYFLSVTTTDRLEPTFIIAPTLHHCPPGPGTSSLDLVVLRPARDPTVQKTSDEAERAAARAARLGEAMGWAYQNGKHVDMTYSTTHPGETEENGEGGVVCEVFRCSGFDWIPQDPTHDRSHLVCADGSIHTIPPGGKASVTVLHAPPGAPENGFFVYA